MSGSAVRMTVPFRYGDGNPTSVVKVSVMEWIDDEWIEQLYGCPSQCYRRVKCNGNVYTLYIRWRWEDPWEFFIVDGDLLAEHIFWVEEGYLFAKYKRRFSHDEYKEAEKAAEEIFKEWIGGREHAR